MIQNHARQYLRVTIDYLALISSTGLSLPSIKLECGTGCGINLGGILGESFYDR